MYKCGVNRANGKTFLEQLYLSVKNQIVLDF